MDSIRSMTGFGRSETVTDQYRISAEIKSVNHRYLDLSVKMPRRFNCFESRIRQLLKEYMERGKADLYISYEDYTVAGRRLIYNRDLAAEYLGYINDMASEFGIRNDISACSLSRYPDVLIMEDTEGGDERLWGILEPVLRSAVSAFVKDREREGQNLKGDLMGKLDIIENCVNEIESISPSIVDEYRERLYNRIRETLSDASVLADEGRIVTEVAIYADRICTDEEMVRLRSHVEAIRKKLESGGGCGRELDFIAQEMNREANTSLSKANNLKKADIAIALKAEIEKVREQVQNIE